MFYVQQDLIATTKKVYGETNCLQKVIWVLLAFVLSKMTIYQIPRLYQIVLNTQYFLNYQTNSSKVIADALVYISYFNLPLNIPV